MARKRGTKEATPISRWPLFLASNWQAQRPTSVQDRPLLSVISATQPRKGNRVIETDGPGHGNRTHVRKLGNLHPERPTQFGNNLGTKRHFIGRFLGPD